MTDSFYQNFESKSLPKYSSHLISTVYVTRTVKSPFVFIIIFIYYCNYYNYCYYYHYYYCYSYSYSYYYYHLKPD